MNDQLYDSQMKRFLIDILQYLGVDNLWLLSRMLLVAAGLLEWLTAAIATFAQQFWLPGILKFISRELYVQLVIVALLFLILGLFANGVGARVNWVRPAGFLRWSVVLYIIVVTGGPFFALLDEVRRGAPQVILEAVPLPQIPVNSVSISADGQNYAPFDPTREQYAAQSRLLAPLRDRDGDGVYDPTDLAMALWHATPADVYTGAEAFRIEGAAGAVSIEGLPPAYRALFFGTTDGSLPWYQSDFSTDPNGAQKRAEALALSRVGLAQALVGLLAAASAFTVSVIGLLFTLGTLALYVLFAAFAPLGLFGSHATFVGGLFKSWLWLCAWSVGVTVISHLVTVLLFGGPQLLGMATQYPLSLIFAGLHLYIHWQLYKRSWFQIRTTVLPLARMAARGGKAALDEVPSEESIGQRQEQMGLNDIELTDVGQAGMAGAHARPLVPGDTTLGGVVHGASTGLGLYNLISADMEDAARARQPSASADRRSFAGALSAGHTLYGRVGFEPGSAQPGAQDAVQVVPGGETAVAALLQKGYAVRQHAPGQLQAWRPLQGTSGWGAGQILADAPEQARPLGPAHRGALLAGQVLGLPEAALMTLARQQGIAPEAGEIRDLTTTQAGRLRQAVSTLSSAECALLQSSSNDTLGEGPADAAAAAAPSAPSLVADVVLPPSTDPLAALQGAAHDGAIDSVALQPTLGTHAEALAELGTRYGAPTVLRAATAAQQAFATLQQDGTAYDQLAQGINTGTIPPVVQQRMQQVAPEVAATDARLVAQVALGARAPLTPQAIAQSVGTTVAAGGDLRTLAAVSGVDARQFGHRATHVGQYLAWATTNGVAAADASAMVHDQLTHGDLAPTTATALSPAVRTQGAAILRAFPPAAQWTVPLIDIPTTSSPIVDQAPDAAGILESDESEASTSIVDISVDALNSSAAAVSPSAGDASATEIITDRLVPPAEMEAPPAVGWMGALTERLNAPLEAGMAAVDQQVGAAFVALNHGVDTVGITFEHTITDGADGLNDALDDGAEAVDVTVDVTNDAFDALSGVPRPRIRRDTARAAQRATRRADADSLREAPVHSTPQLERTAHRWAAATPPAAPPASTESRPAKRVQRQSKKDKE